MYSHSKFLCKLRQVKSHLYQTFHALPFIWDPTQNLYIQDSRCRANFNRESCIHLIVAIFQTIQIFNLIQSGQVNQLTFLYFLWIVHTMHVFHTCLLIWELGGYLNFLNGTIQFGCKIASK